MRVNADLSRVALLQRNDGTGEYTVAVLDSATGGELFEWSVSEALVAGTPELNLVGGNLLLINLRPWKTDTEWIYRCTY